MRFPAVQAPRSPAGASLLPWVCACDLTRRHGTTSRESAVELQKLGSFDLFTLDMITGDEIRQYLPKDDLDPGM